MTRPSRPVLRWHGGKWKLAPWIISFFPSHRVYVEPFGGAASVLLRKERAYAEVYNDLDDDVVNLFRVLQNPEQGGALVRLLELTPFARTEFELGWDETDDHVEKARRLIIRAFMGFGSNAHSDKGRGHKTTGFRANSSRSGTTPARISRRPRSCAPLDQNDRDNARRLIIWFGDDIVYVSGMGWLTWRGTHWQRDEGDLGARLLAQNVVDKIKLEAALAQGDAAAAARARRGGWRGRRSPSERTPADEALRRMGKILEALSKKRSTG
jgi:hypothetical protein